MNNVPPPASRRPATQEQPEDSLSTRLDPAAPPKFDFPPKPLVGPPAVLATTPLLPAFGLTPPFPLLATPVIPD